MPRPLRYDVVGVPQHVIQRGVNRQRTFFSRRDCHRYLGWLGRAVGLAPVAVGEEAVGQDQLHAAQGLDHRAVFLQLFLLRADDQEVHDPDDQDQRDEASEGCGTTTSGGGLGKGVGNQHIELLRGDEKPRSITAAADGLPCAGAGGAPGAGSGAQKKAASAVRQTPSNLHEGEEGEKHGWAGRMTGGRPEVAQAALFI